MFIKSIHIFHINIIICQHPGKIPPYVANLSPRKVLALIFSTYNFNDYNKPAIEIHRVHYHEGIIKVIPENMNLNIQIEQFYPHVHICNCDLN